eukprot:585602_1
MKMNNSYNTLQRALGYIKHMRSNRNRSPPPTIIQKRSLRIFYITAGAMIGATSIAYGVGFYVRGPKIRTTYKPQKDAGAIDVDETLLQSVRIHNVKDRAVDSSTADVGD